MSIFDNPQLEQFESKGWAKFPFDPQLEHWLLSVETPVREATHTEQNKQWFRYGGTWFAGVNALPNNEDGAVNGGPPLSGAAVDFVRNSLGFTGPWDQAQISICYPGYPKPMVREEGFIESKAVYEYRLHKDAAHVDGLRRSGPERRRFLEERHAFILGLPLTDHPEDAAPFTIWEGSHQLVGDAFRQFYGGVSPETWQQRDVTDIYHSVRKQCFDRCRRMRLHARPGEAYLVHRHALHGVAPWAEELPTTAQERAILYFRPYLQDSGSWIS